MTPRQAGETQRAYVERVLAAEGRIATYDVLYGLSYADGQKCSITRLAAIIHTLRHEAGWTIAEGHENGLAVYRLVAAAGPGRPVGKVRQCPGCHREHAVGTACSSVAA